MTRLGALADMTGISQPTLSRITSGARAVKMPEIVAIAWATGHTVAQLTESDGRTMAARFRGDHHLGVQPLGDLVAIIDQATGIDVAVLDVGPDEHGFTMRDPASDAVFVGVARTRRPMR